jgi:AraC-like DNA-binding protein
MTVQGIAFDAPGREPMINSVRSQFPAAGVKFYGIATLVSLICYSIIILLMLNRHRQNIPDYFSSMPAEITLNWLRWITIAFSFSVIYVITAAFIAPEFFRHPFLSPRISHPLSITFFIIIFLFFNLQQPDIYIGEMESETPDGQWSRRYEKSGLKNDDAEKYLKKIEDYMKSEKPYHDGELTIADLSESLNIPRHYITQIINERLNKNFYFFINEYRVNEVKEKLTDSAYGEHTLLRIALDAGFNSKSSFNIIFKKITGMTPSEFRKAVS